MLNQAQKLDLTNQLPNNQPTMVVTPIQLPMLLEVDLNLLIQMLVLVNGGKFNSHKNTG
jgi:hypothetical protein